MHGNALKLYIVRNEDPLETVYELLWSDKDDNNLNNMLRLSIQ